jgi:hypothetical protein
MVSLIDTKAPWIDGRTSFSKTLQLARHPEAMRTHNGATGTR